MDWVNFGQPTLDWLIRTFLIGGVGYNIYRYLKTRRSRNAQGVVDQGTIPHKIETSSITTLQAGQVAMIASFEAERTAYERTIVFQENQIRDLSTQVEQRDSRHQRDLDTISGLQEEISQMQEQIRRQARQLTDMADRLQNITLDESGTK